MVNSERVSKVLRPARHIIGHFGNGQSRQSLAMVLKVTLTTEQPKRAADHRYQDHQRIIHRDAIVYNFAGSRQNAAPRTVSGV